MNTARKRYVDPIVYELGTDLSYERYQEIVTSITDWFVEYRNTSEPALLAKQLVDECMKGVKQDGSPWFAMANGTLAARIRSKCRYDIDKMVPLRTAPEKQKIKKAKEKKRQAARKAKESKDKFIPDEIRKELQREVKYGEDPSVWMTSAEQKMWWELYEDFQKQFPELGTISAAAELKMLCDTHVLMERFRMQQLAGKSVDQEALEATVKRFMGLKKSLGIHPDQLKHRTKGLMDASIGEAVARFASKGEQYLELRKRFILEEMLQMWQMCHTPTADGSGYQLDEVELYGLTRSKPEPCPNCGTIVYGGLTLEQIEEYLIRHKAIELEETHEDSTRDSEGHDEGAVEPSSRTEDRGGESTTDTGTVAT